MHVGAGRHDERLRVPEQDAAVLDDDLHLPPRGPAAPVVGDRPGRLDELERRTRPDPDPQADVVAAEQQRPGRDERDPERAAVVVQRVGAERSAAQVRDRATRRRVPRPWRRREDSPPRPSSRAGPGAGAPGRAPIRPGRSCPARRWASRARRDPVRRRPARGRAGARGRACRRRARASGACPPSSSAWKCGAIGPGSWATCGAGAVRGEQARAARHRARRPTRGRGGTARAPGRPSRAADASATIRATSTPTCGARSVLLTSSRSARAMPGPPLRATSPPPATSRTKICASTRAGEKVAVRLSPPDSTRTTSSGAKSCSRSSTASRFAVTSSRIAVCGQAPVSTARIRSGSRTPAERRKRASSSV